MTCKYCFTVKARRPDFAPTGPAGANKPTGQEPAPIITATRQTVKANQAKHNRHRTPVTALLPRSPAPIKPPQLTSLLNKPCTIAAPNLPPQQVKQVQQTAPCRRHRTPLTYLSPTPCRPRLPPPPVNTVRPSGPHHAAALIQSTSWQRIMQHSSAAAIQFLFTWQSILQRGVSNFRRRKLSISHSADPPVKPPTGTVQTQR